MNKKLIDKMTSPKRARSSVVAGQAGAKVSNSIANSVAIAEDNAEKLLNEMKNMQPGYEFILVTEEQQLSEYIDLAIESGYITMDTEGSGLDPINDYVCGFSLYTPASKQAIYVPFWHTDFQENVLEGQMEYEAAKRQVERIQYLSQQHKLKVILGNAKYDIRITKNTLDQDYIIAYWDVILASMFLNENEPSGLKYLWDKYVYRKEQKEELKTFDKLFGRHGFNWFKPERVFVYAANDALMTWQVYEFQQQYLDPEGKMNKQAQLQDAGKLFKEIEMPLINELVKMEDLGITIDVERAAELEKTYSERLEKTTKEADEMIAAYNLDSLPAEKLDKLTRPINVGSPTQIAIIIYDVLKLPLIGNKRGTGVDVLNQLMEEHPQHKEFMAKVLEYRGLTKLLSTYIVKIPKLIKEKTGRLHGQINQYGAKTGRTSSKDPNLQNIPARNRDIRPMFVATEGYYLISGDFKQQEPRVLAHLSGDSEMIKAYKEGKDLYSWIASTVYKKPYEDCLEFNPVTHELQPDGDRMREEMKSVVLGAMYGRGAGAIAEQVGCSYAEAQGIIDTFYGAFPAVRRYITERQEFCKRTGYVTTAYGRKRRLPDLQLPEFEVLDINTKQPIQDEMVAAAISKQMQGATNRYEKREIIQYWKQRGVTIKDNGGFIAEASRQVINSEVQGSAADITKKAMLEVGRDEQLEKLGFRMLVSVHDEIIGEVPKENALQAKDRLAEVMINSCADVISVPMAIDSEIIERWYGEDLTEKLVN